MEVRTKRGEEFTEVSTVTIRLGEVDFRITENKFGGIIVLKIQHGEETNDIMITPNVANEIRIK